MFETVKKRKRFNSIAVLFVKTLVMKKIVLFLISCSAVSAYGQSNYSVVATGNAWFPDTLTIEVGDSVTFTNNNQGLHNINGTTATYPSNPESFGMLASSQNWMYGHRFNTPGNYSYRCDVHASMMTGSIKVNPPAGITENDGDFILYPNPVEDILTLAVQYSNYEVVVSDMLGNEILTRKMNGENVLDLSKLNSGTYLISVNFDGATMETQRFVKK